MPVYTNIAAYRFATLSDLKPLREELIGLCKAWNLKGTILLSTEGINLFLAGEQENVERLLSRLRQIPGLEDLQPKYSDSVHQPFRRMLVRIKKEIIAFGVPGVEPARRTSPKLSPATLKQWLDEGRPVTLLDTRNDYEVKLGTFDNALPIGIDHFREFPNAVGKLPAGLKEQPIVMFCTGGIRCEKAGPYMEMQGFQQIYQLDGGILKYFEDCGSAHYHGECFVFDQRVGVDGGLHETGTQQCFQCQAPLSPEDQQDPRFVAGESCPYCNTQPEEQAKKRIAQREAQIRQICTPLPGSAPFDNYRPVNVPAAYDGCALIECLAGLFPQVPAETWSARFAADLIRDFRKVPVPASHRVRSGDRFFHLLRSEVEPAVNPEIRVIHEDEAIIVLNKPAPLPVHPGGRFNRNTLKFILNAAYAPEKPRPAHRLDANTTGVMVFSRTRHFAALLQPQFTAGTVQKVYLVRVQGSPAWECLTCDVPISSTPGELGTREVDETAGDEARTEFRVLERHPDGTTSLEARPLTGRTNQIRVHLWELGMPVVGDPAYLPGKQLGTTQTLSVEAPPMRLHAGKISFTHPLTRERVTFEAEAAHGFAVVG